jgi:hypothetical protein
MSRAGLATLKGLTLPLTGVDFETKNLIYQFFGSLTCQFDIILKTNVLQFKIVQIDFRTLLNIGTTKIILVLGYNIWLSDRCKIIDDILTFQ